MESLRVVRRRIKSVQNTHAITRAMEMVAGSKLRRAQHQWQQHREGFRFLDELLARLVRDVPQYRHPLLDSREPRRVGLIAFASDTGLCGAFNMNMFRAAEEWVRGQSPPVTVIPVGRRIGRYAQKRGWMVEGPAWEFGGRLRRELLADLTRQALALFTDGKVDRLYLGYTRFVSTMVWKPVVVPCLPVPVERPPAEEWTAYREYIYEPSPEAVLEDLLPRWAAAKIEATLLESFTSEHSARMVAMRNATKNAEDMTKRLVLARNKARQAAITKEILEIVSTAEALK